MTFGKDETVERRPGDTPLFGENELSANEGFPELSCWAALPTPAEQMPCQQNTTDLPAPCSHPESSAKLSATLFPWSGILFPTPTAGVPGAQVTIIPLCFKELVCGKNENSALTASKRPSSLLDA